MDGLASLDDAHHRSRRIGLIAALTARNRRRWRRHAVTDLAVSASLEARPGRRPELRRRAITDRRWSIGRLWESGVQGRGAPISLQRTTPEQTNDAIAFGLVGSSSPSPDGMRPRSTADLCASMGTVLSGHTNSTRHGRPWPVASRHQRQVQRRGQGYRPGLHRARRSRSAGDAATRRWPPVVDDCAAGR